jgi:hypothetical protein
MTRARRASGGAASGLPSICLSSTSACPRPSATAQSAAVARALRARGAVRARNHSSCRPKKKAKPRNKPSQNKKAPRHPERARRKTPIRDKAPARASRRTQHLSPANDRSETEPLPARPLPPAFRGNTPPCPSEPPCDPLCLPPTSAVLCAKPSPKPSAESAG